MNAQRTHIRRLACWGLAALLLLAALFFVPFRGDKPSPFSPGNWDALPPAPAEAEGTLYILPYVPQPISNKAQGPDGLKAFLWLLSGLAIAYLLLSCLRLAPLKEYIPFFARHVLVHVGTHAPPGLI